MSGATPVCACGEHKPVNEQAWSLRLSVHPPHHGAAAADLEQEQCEGAACSRLHSWSWLITSSSLSPNYDAVLSR